MAHFDDDFALALQLQEQFNDEKAPEKIDDATKNIKSPTLVDPYWETTDPNPDVRALFLQFNDRFFWGRLAGIEVRWSPRMTLCAGLCCYEGRGGLCSVRLSVPLLKLRPRKDLVETLLHEMIHAYLFVTDNNKDHDGHGPEFHKHMYRINKEAGTNITVYHNFHDEVESYRQHWWRCDGSCRERKPFYGYVKRTMNRAPSKNDTWWAEHQRTCGGTFTKIKEPEDYGKKKGKIKDKDKEKDKEGKETSKKEVKTSVKSMDIRIFGGKGVTLSGQTTSSGNSSTSSSSSSSSVVPTSVKRPPSATVTSADMDTDDRNESSSILTKPTVSQSKTAGKVDVNPKGSWSKEDNDKVDFKVGKVHTKGVAQSKFTDSDFSDSDDSFLSTVSNFEDVMISTADEQSSGKAVDKSKSDDKNVNSVKDVNIKVDNRPNNEKQVENDKESESSDDVRAMLRKVWGEKNMGIGNKKKIFSKKISGTMQGNKDKRKPLNGPSGTSISKGTGFGTSKNCQTTDKGKSKVNVIQHDNKKRHIVVDSFDDNPVRKRLKTDSATKQDIFQRKSQSDKDSLDEKLNNHFRDSFNGPNLKNHHKPSDGTVAKNRGDFESVNKVKKAESAKTQTANASPVKSPKQIMTPAKHDDSVKSPIKKLFDAVKKSPIGKLFDKIRDKQTDSGASNEASGSDRKVPMNTTSKDSLRDYDLVPAVRVSVTPVAGEMQDISSCPVCNQGVPTASINEHLDLCLALNAI